MSTEKTLDGSKKYWEKNYQEIDRFLLTTFSKPTFDNLVSLESKISLLESLVYHLPEVWVKDVKKQYESEYNQLLKELNL